MHPKATSALPRPEPTIGVTEAGTYQRIDRRPILRIRLAFQWGLFAVIVYSGHRLYLFREHFLAGTPQVERPPMVEGFLPIGSLMSLRLWLTEGVLDPVHPAGLVIFSAALLMSLVLKKSFCGWVCPVGTVSELAYKIGARAIGRNLAPPRYADYPLRSLKYLLLGFFLYIVIFGMDGRAISAFMNTPYWKVADVKMLYFFTDMSTLTAWVLGGLVVLSFVVRNFWCRYLCPYGALVGLLSLLSPFKITRDDGACIKCGRCTKSCPAMLPVAEKARVRSPECTGCLTCVGNCPARGALDIALPGNRPTRPLIYMAMIAVVFFGIISAAMLSGHWKSNVTYEEYRSLVPSASRYEHP